MRVLHVNDYAPASAGGAEIYLARLIDAQRAAGDVVEVVTGDIKSGLGRLGDVWSRAARAHVTAAIASFAPDVVHVHNVARELSASVYGAADVPVVATAHDLRAFGGSEHRLPTPRAIGDRMLLGPLQRRAVRRHVAQVIAISAPVEDALRRAGVQDVTRVPVPVVAPTATLRRPSECRDIVFAGRLSRDKGAHVLIEAFAAAAPTAPGSRLVIAGDGPLRRDLERQAATSGAPIVFTGRLDAAALSEVYAAALAVVVPSLPALRPEGSSLTAAEAARHGRLVIGSDDPAVAEVVRACDGVIVPAGSVRDLTVALTAVLADRGEADRRGDVALTAATARHDSTVVAAAVREVYRQAGALRPSPEVVSA